MHLSKRGELKKIECDYISFIGWYREIGRHLYYFMTAIDEDGKVATVVYCMNRSLEWERTHKWCNF